MAHNAGIKQAMVRARINEDLKIEVEEIFNEVGLTVSEAIRLFFKRVKIEKGLPFEVKIPNAATLKAMRDMENGTDIETAKDTDDLWKKLNS